MNEGIQSLFDRLWSDYTRINPQAQKIHQLLVDRGDRVVNDHVAFRTFRHSRLGIDATARLFEQYGYSARDEYEFPEKRLYARQYASDEPGMPRVFISELELDEFSRGLRDIVSSLLRQVDPAALSEDAFVLGGCPWHPVLHDTYERLRAESDYAAWLAAFGFRPNHFTLSVNGLESFDSLAQLNAFLKDNGFPLNETGGEIKGSRDSFLEQSSTAAAPCDVRFADAEMEIPGCCYEFAWRHRLPNGELFPGFVTNSANQVPDGAGYRASP